MGANPNKDSSLSKAHQKLREQALKQGYQSAKTPEEFLGNFWPESESIDELLSSIRQLRQSEA